VRRLPFHRVEQLSGGKGRAVHGPITLHPDYSKSNTIITVNPYLPKMAWLSHFKRPEAQKRCQVRNMPLDLPTGSAGCDNYPRGDICD
jgi:hypothetical protein